MKRLKILGLGLVAAALMAFVGAGIASATVLTKEGGVKMVAGEEIDASIEGASVLKAGFQEFTCTEGTIKGSIKNAGGAEATVSEETSNVSFVESSCNCWPIVVANGVLEIHNISGTSNGTIAASGFTTTMTCNSIFGKVTCHCITGNNKDLGTLTGSNSIGSTATMDVNTTLTREEVGSSLCAETATWEAK